MLDLGAQQLTWVLGAAWRTEPRARQDLLMPASLGPALTAAEATRETLE